MAWEKDEVGWKGLERLRGGGEEWGKMKRKRN